jgi:hypothetical protein
MIGDWDTDRQPAAAPREPMAQRGGRKIDAGGATFLAISGRLEDRRFEAGVLPVVSRNSFRHPVVGAAFTATLCVIANQGLGVAGAAFTAILALSKTDVRG